MMMVEPNHLKIFVEKDERQMGQQTQMGHDSQIHYHMPHDCGTAISVLEVWVASSM